MTEAREQYLAAVGQGMSEKEWQAHVREIAEAYGWRVYCWWRSDKSPAGWPDVTMLRPPRTVVAELKTVKGRLSRAQREALKLLEACGHEVYAWRPQDMDQVHEVLGW